MLHTGLRLAIFAVAALLTLHPSTSPAQDLPSSAASNIPAQDEYNHVTDQDIQMLRKNLRSQRKQLIAANLPLTPAEAEKFWPVYDQYVNELVAINGKKYGLIKQYLQIGATMSDAQAVDCVKQWIEVDRSVSDLRMKYVPIFGKVLTPKKTALYYQLDRRVQLMIDLQLTSALPLIEP